MKKIAILLMGLMLVMVSGCKQEESELYKPDVSVLDLDET